MSVFFKTAGPRCKPGGSGLQSKSRLEATVVGSSVTRKIGDISED
jgi:hypothetical protein